MDLRNDSTVAVADELAGADHSGTLIPAYIDLLDAEAVNELVAAHRPGAIVHLAAIVSPPSYRNPELARRVNVGGTENLLSACVALPHPPLFFDGIKRRGVRIAQPLPSARADHPGHRR